MNKLKPWLALWAVLLVLLWFLLNSCAQMVPDESKPHVFNCGPEIVNHSQCVNGSITVYESRCHATVFDVVFLALQDFLSFPMPVTCLIGIDEQSHTTFYSEVVMGYANNM